MKFKKRLKNTTETVNTETGEIIQTSKEFNIVVKTETFYFTFIEAISFIHNIKSEFPVLAMLCMNSEFNTGNCYLNPQRRKEFAQQLDMTTANFNMALYRLEKKGAIKNNRGTVEINPLYLWKGSIEERNKTLREKGLDIRINFKSVENNKEND